MKYSNEEKLSIIARYQQGASIATLSDELDIPRSTLYRWLKSFPMDSAGKPLKFSYQEYALLQRKVEKLQNVITILKSVDCLVSAPLKERLHALEPFYGKYEVHTICEALDVDRGTFYNHMLRSKRGNAWFDKRRQEYCQLIRDVFDEYRQVLGAEKIRTILVQRGHQVSAEYVSRLMHEMGLSSVRTTAKQEYLKLREPERKKNILRQQFSAQQPNQRWVSDVTCFKLASMMASLAGGGAVGQNIAGAINHMMGGIQQPMQSGMTPPPIPAAEYHIAVNGQATGPFDLAVLAQMMLYLNHISSPMHPLSLAYAVGFFLEKHEQGANAVDCCCQPSPYTHISING